MKKGYRILALALVLCVLMCCGCSSSDASDQSWKKVADAGVLKVGVYDNYFPMCSPMGTSYDGYDVDLIEELCARLNVEVQYVDILASEKPVEVLMADGLIDCAIGGISYSSELEEMFLLSEPYLTDSHVIVVADNVKCKNLADIAGKTVSVAKESLSYQAFRASPLLFESAQEIRLLAGEIAVLNGVAERQTDLAITRKTIAEYYSVNHHELTLMQNENDENETLGTMNYVILFPPKSGALAAKIADAYATMKRDHVTEDLYRTWFQEKQPTTDVTDQPLETAALE